jgi:hypothetical protein
MSRLFRLILRVYFCDPSPKRGGVEQLSTAMETRNSHSYEPSSRSRTGSRHTILSDVVLVGSIP